MKLLSIHVGKPREVEFEGRTVSTAIFKEIVEGPVKVETLNLEGDGQADLRVHGGARKAVYAYPSEHYTYWKDARKDHNFYPGVFGENLSISGLTESDVCVGDVYQIGSAIFSVTEPRMPCYKLGIRMDDPGFVKEFNDTKRNGFYFQVLQEGTIEAGMEIVKMRDDGHHLSIQNVIDLKTTDQKNLELLQKASTSPSLRQEKREKYEVMYLKLTGRSV